MARIALANPHPVATASGALPPLPLLRLALAFLGQTAALLDLALGAQRLDLLLLSGPLISLIASVGCIRLFAAEAVDLVGEITLP